LNRQWIRFVSLNSPLMLTPAQILPIGTPICLDMYPPVMFPIAPVGSAMSISLSLTMTQDMFLMTTSHLKNHVKHVGIHLCLLE
jgi:hypothetical protein